MNNYTVRPMRLDETQLVIDYLHNSTPEHLDMMGVDPTRLLSPDAWRERYAQEFATPIEKRTSFLTIWLDRDTPVGYSTTTHIKFGDSAHMHLHVLEPERRKSGIGAVCVPQSVKLYFEHLKLKRLFCEPNALNVAPNRTLAAVGFKYVKTYMTVPGPINFHQPVTRWVYEPKS
ncbi:MAG: GNAT family N-acetyltransferase [Alphaproteobacteria bacterium]|nr:GNAT family N-acetyltransferase [Alphaproteobacteria bacterium]MBV9421236.1 GNAT family N-acetyltransferase [Alphaproteobacteria bacterium]MBV9542348.1 GNAT family N-acetyltransferase [Alphaproteobacteria bacterium]MBV9904473.1 GNAT family N-acetyltransferase [Alphaproteobacteria bacterium]